MPTNSNTQPDQNPLMDRMPSVFSMDTTTDITLSEDEKRLVHAQQLLNDVRDLYDQVDRNEPDEDRLRTIQKTLSETGVVLEIAEYDDTENIKNAIARIERYLTSKHTNSSEDDLFAKRELALRRIDSAIQTNPMHDL